MQSKLHFLISLDTTDNGAVDLAAGISRVAIPFARRVTPPAAKKNGQRTFDLCSARTD